MADDETGMMRWHHAEYWQDGTPSELRCKLPTLADRGGEIEDGEFVPLLARCDEVVWLEWTILLDPSFAYADNKEAGEGAFNSGWKLTCAAGHVLIVSSQEDRSAPPYDPSKVGVMRSVFPKSTAGDTVGNSMTERMDRRP